MSTEDLPDPRARRDALSSLPDRPISQAKVLGREIYIDSTLIDVHEHTRRQREYPSPLLPNVRRVENPHQPVTLNLTVEMDLWAGASLSDETRLWLACRRMGSRWSLVHSGAG